jgi:hypothetical protein
MHPLFHRVYVILIRDRLRPNGNTRKAMLVAIYARNLLIKGRWGRLTDEIKWKWPKELEQFAAVLPDANGHRANFAICRASFAKSKERTRSVLQPDFRVWKDRFAGKQCTQSRLFSHLFKLTAAHSSNHRDSQMLLRNIREWETEYRL